MPCPGLSLIGLICTVTVVLLIGESRGKEMSFKNGRPSNAIRQQQDLHLGNDFCDRVCINENEGRRKKFRKPPRWIQELNSITLKLKIIRGKYDEEREHLNELYKGVANCGLSNCGKYPNVLPEKMKPKKFNCKKFKKLEDLKKWTSVILSKGYNGSKTCKDQFEELIRFEKSPRFLQQDKNNGSRLRILRGFQSQIKALSEDILELKLIKKKERLSTSKSVLQNPDSETELKIREWGILQQSKEYLSLFFKSLQHVCECWKGRKWVRKISQKKNARKFSNQAKKYGGTRGQN